MFYIKFLLRYIKFVVSDSVIHQRQFIKYPFVPEEAYLISSFT